MDDFKERLFLFVRDYAGTSNREFEKRCGLTNGQLGSIGVQGPTASVVSRIADTFPDLDLNWLFRGTGSMLLSKTKSTAPQNDIHHNETVNINYGALKDVIKEAIKEAIR